MEYLKWFAMSETADDADRKRYSREVTYNTIGNVVSLFCQWIIILLIPILSDFHDAGVFAVALSVCSIMNIVATFYLNKYQISDQYRKHRENSYKVCRIFTILLSFCLTVPIVVILNYDLEQVLVIFAYLLYRNFMHMAYVYTASLQICHRLDYVGKMLAVEGIISLLVFLVSFTATSSLIISTALMAVLGGGSFLILVLRGYKKYAYVRTKLNIGDTEELRPLLVAGIPLLLSSVASITITAMPKLVLQASWSETIVGIFSTLSAPTIIIPTVAASVFEPFIIYFAELSRRGDMPLLRRKYNMVVLAIVGFGIIALVACMTLAPWFFGMLYGDEIIQYMDCFYILVVGIVFYTIGTVGTTVLITKNQGRSTAMASLTALAIGTALFLIIIPTRGIIGASLTLMAAYGLYGLIISLCVYILPTLKTAEE